MLTLSELDDLFDFLSLEKSGSRDKTGCDLCFRLKIVGVSQLIHFIVIVWLSAVTVCLHINIYSFLVPVVSPMDSLCVTSRCWGCGGETCRSQRGWEKILPPLQPPHSHPRQLQRGLTFHGSQRPHGWTRSPSSSWLPQHRRSLAFLYGSLSSSRVTR